MSKYASWSDEEVVDELADIESGLTDWELKFVDSVHKQVKDQKRPLSVKPGGQRDMAEKILAKLRR